MTDRWWTDHVKARRYRIVSQVSTGLCHSEVSFRKIMLARTGAMVIENTTAPSRANATVQAIGRNRRPSTCWSVKIGRYAVMIIIIAKKTGRWTSCAAARIVGNRFMDVLLV